MGIPLLWQRIKEQDHSVPIAQLAEDHHKSHGRPLKIAVDEADWRFNNLTGQQVYLIREHSNQPAFQGVEKSMFYRICRLLTLNIRLLFVFDGPRRPAKRGRPGGGKIDYESRKLLKELLRYFRIPYHEAPGEAEAECARLQQLGVVDAVFSQDSDTLMFGCDFLIRDDRIAKEKGNTDRSKENTKKSPKLVRVVRGSEIRRAHKFDKDALVLFAMLVGGDYDTKGLPGCGHSAAYHAVQTGLGSSLSKCQTQQDFQAWREGLVAFLQTIPQTRNVQVPHNFPDVRILNKYNRPTVSTDEALLNLSQLRKGWDQPIDELKLLELTSSRFNIWGRLYMNWVGPVLLTRSFVALDSTLEGNPHQIILTKRRAQKNDDQLPPRVLERKLTFSPFGVTSLTRKDFEGDRAGYWTSAMDQPFDPKHEVECEMPEYWLQKALPPQVLDPPHPTPKSTSRKRKQNAGDHLTDTPTLLKKRKSGPRPKAGNAKNPAPTPATNFPNIVDICGGSRALASKNSVVDLLSDSEGEDSDTLEDFVFCSFQPIPSASTVRNKISPNVSKPQPISSHPKSLPTLALGSGSDDSDEDDDAQLREAIRLSLQEASSTREQPPRSVSSTTPLPKAFKQTKRSPYQQASDLIARDSPTKPSHRASDTPTAPTAINQVRAARLHHFTGQNQDQGQGEGSASKNGAETSACIYRLSRNKRVEKRQKKKNPLEIECIDLTDD